MCLNNGENLLTVDQRLRYKVDDLFEEISSLRARIERVENTQKIQMRLVEARPIFPESSDADSHFVKAVS